MNGAELVRRYHAAVLELTRQFRECAGRFAMEVMHDDNAPAMFLQLTHPSAGTHTKDTIIRRQLV